MYSLKRKNIVENKSNMFERVNENENMLNKQFSSDENWLCGLARFGKLDIQFMCFIKTRKPSLNTQSDCITYFHSDSLSRANMLLLVSTVDSLTRTSRSFEPKEISPGFPSYNHCNILPSITRTPANSNQFSFPLRPFSI